MLSLTFKTDGQSQEAAENKNFAKKLKSSKTRFFLFTLSATTIEHTHLLTQQCKNNDNKQCKTISWYLLPVIMQLSKIEVLMNTHFM